MYSMHDEYHWNIWSIDTICSLDLFCFPWHACWSQEFGRTKRGKVYVCNWHSNLGNSPFINELHFKTSFVKSPRGIHSIFFNISTIIPIICICQKAHWGAGMESYSFLGLQHHVSLVVERMTVYPSLWMSPSILQDSAQMSHLQWSPVTPGRTYLLFCQHPYSILYYVPLITLYFDELVMIFLVLLWTSWGQGPWFTSLCTPKT